MAGPALTQRVRESRGEQGGHPLGTANFLALHPGISLFHQAVSFAPANLFPQAAACRGGVETQIGRFETASRLEAADLRLHAAAARRRLGEQVGGSEGYRLVEQADAWMKGQKVRRPERMTALLAPGFPDPLS